MMMRYGDSGSVVLMMMRRRRMKMILVTLLNSGRRYVCISVLWEWFLPVSGQCLFRRES